MHYHHTILFASVASLLCACSQDTGFIKPEPRVKATLTATFEPQTKVALGEDYSISWEEGDRIMVSDGAKRTQFTATSSGESATLEAEGVILTGGRTYYALYPYDQAYISGDDLRVQIPSVIKGTAGLCPPLPAVAAMDGDERQLEFRNVCSLISFEIDGNDIVSVEIKGGGDEILAGSVLVSNPESPQVEVIQGETSVMLYADNALEAGRYYIPMLPHDFTSGLSILMKKTDGSEVPRSYGAFTLDRSRYMDLENIDTGRYIHYVLNTAEDLQAFLDDAPDCPAYVSATMRENIDLSGVSLKGASAFAGTFDGNGHTLSNWECAAPLFMELSAGATVTGLDIAATCSLDFADSQRMAFIADINKGTINSCTSSADFNIPSGGMQYITGAFAAVSEGIVSDCTNNGMVTINGSHIAVGGAVGENLGDLSGCVNNGRIVAEGQAPAVGGVCGLSDGGGTISSCKNTGPVRLNADEAVSPCLGGIAGRVIEGAITGCTNSGDITAHGSAVSSAAAGGIAGSVGPDTPSSNWSLAVSRNNGSIDVSISGAEIYAGGVAGLASVPATTSTRNTGKVTVAAGLNSTANAGGVIGKSFHEYNSLYNEGEVEVSLADAIGTARVGGIAGYMAGSQLSGANHVVTGQNQGAIRVSGGSMSVYELYIGGVVGLCAVPNVSSSNTSWVTCNTNYAAIEVNTPLRVIVGGVIAREYGLGITASSPSLSGAKNSGAITVTSPGADSYIGGVVGWHGRGRLGNANAFGQASDKAAITVTGADSSVYVGGYAGWLSSDNGGNYPACCTCISGCAFYGSIDAPGATAGVIAGAVNLVGRTTTNGIMLGSSASERLKVSSSFALNGTVIDDIGSDAFTVNTFFGAINPSATTTRTAADGTSLQNIWYMCASGSTATEASYKDGLVTI